MSLKLNPGGSQQIERCRWNERSRLPGHEQVAKHPRIRIPQIVLGRLRGVCFGHIVSEPHTSTAHEGHFERIVLAIRVASVDKAFVSKRLFGFVSLCCTSNIAVYQVVGAELNTQGVKIESSNVGWKLMPGNESVDEVKGTDKYPFDEGGLKGRSRWIHTGELFKLSQPAIA